MIIYLITFIVTFALCGVLSKAGILFSSPTARGLHTSNVPTSGGIALFIGYMIITLFEYYKSSNIIDIQILLFVSLITFLGFLDDKYDVNKIMRFIGQSILSYLAIYYLLNSYNIELYGHFEKILFSLLFVYFINTYNFMDGIDLIAINQALFLSIALLTYTFILNTTANIQLANYSIGLIVIIIGFYYYNLSPPKLFLGNSGSYFLGFILVIMIFEHVINNSINLYQILILHSVFIIDTGYTITLRFIDKFEKSSFMKSLIHITNPHCLHAYQKISIREKNHFKVSTKIMIYNLIWCLPLSIYVKELNFELTVFLLIVSYLPYLYICKKNNAGIADD